MPESEDSKTTVLEEWDANPGQEPYAFMRRMSDGTWIYGTSSRSPGDFYPEQTFMATDAQAREWFRERWGYTPSNAIDFFPATTGYTIGAHVIYDGELPCDAASHAGTVTLVSPDASGDQIVTVEFDCGLTQDLPGSELRLSS